MWPLGNIFGPWAKVFSSSENILRVTANFFSYKWKFKENFEEKNRNSFKCDRGLITRATCATRNQLEINNGHNGYNGRVTFSQVDWLIGCWLVSASHKSISSKRKRKIILSTSWLLTCCSKKAWAAEKSSKKGRLEINRFSLVTAWINRLVKSTRTAVDFRLNQWSTRN